jgi:hypothetical protein
MCHKVLEMHGGAQVQGQLALRDDAGTTGQYAANGADESIDCAKGL